MISEILKITYYYYTREIEFTKTWKSIPTVFGGDSYGHKKICFLKQIVSALEESVLEGYLSGSDGIHLALQEPSHSPTARSGSNQKGRA